MTCAHISNSSAGGIQGLDRGSGRQAVRSAGRAEVRTRTDSSTLTLKVRTDEGDTVEISIAARTQQTSARASWRDQQGNTKVAERTSTSSFSAQVKVDGNLSDQETADIQHLLESLSSGGEAANVADNSLASYDYAYSRTREVTRANLSVAA